ncbi:flavin reductase family protein [Actinocorallia sp. A-T 12471]|uniref:flavin reductase family protein n=1 Tax=Actinocorallia sp. A-T 12471 TaxID=3089813 RepID=UPI0029D033EE|nr:flavin reductase family protein [Actinocorallia sp. A-T 12471]MDX6738655.1 flavin reductase family protein [Actinocorallia sp. A-T 12471]
MTPPPDPAEFRRVIGAFPTGITVVTTVAADGVAHAMTMSAFSSVSLEPLLVLFCAEKKARFHDTVLARETWAVSILGEHSEAASSWFATRGRPLEGQLDGWATHPGAVTGNPILDEAIGALECRTYAVHDGGDHSIVVGEVLSASTPSDGGPLLYHRGAYRALKPE